METKEQGTMDGVTIQKEKLLEILMENREKHNAIYEAAVSGYYDKVAAELTTKKSQAKNLIAEYDKKFKMVKEESKFDPKFKVSFSPTTFCAKFPENHIYDYDKSIKMVELSVHGLFALTHKEFDQYVMNNWAWKQSFLDNNTPYVTGFYNSGTGVFGGYSGLQLSGAVVSF